MNSVTLTQVENTIDKLSDSEQLWLLERLAHRIRTRHIVTQQSDFDAQLAAMAADPEIQREIQQIAAEFSSTEMGGLEEV